MKFSAYGKIGLNSDVPRVVDSNEEHFHGKLSEFFKWVEENQKDYKHVFFIMDDPVACELYTISHPVKIKE